MVNGKQKGAAFERKICKELSLWISDGKYTDVFWRSAMSGGRTTVAKARGEVLGAQVGDISSVRREGHELTDRFVVECKCYASLQLDKLIVDSGRLLKFWHEISAIALDHGKEAMLIAQQKRSPTLLCVSTWAISRGHWPLPKLSIPSHEMHTFLLNDLVQKPPPW